MKGGVCEFVMTIIEPSNKKRDVGGGRRVSKNVKVPIWNWFETGLKMLNLYLFLIFGTRPFS